jgi:hypothetical protein
MEKIASVRLSRRSKGKLIPHKLFWNNRIINPMKITVSQLRKIIREEVQKNLGEGIATLGLAQKIAGEYPEEEIREFLASPEPEGFGFMPDEIGDDLEGFLAGLSMKDLNTLEKHFGEKYGMWQSSTRKFRA